MLGDCLWNSLPIELWHQIAGHLDLGSLCKFAATSKSNLAVKRDRLRSLRIALWPQGVQKYLPQQESRHIHTARVLQSYHDLEAMFIGHNQLATLLLTCHFHSLRKLELVMWDISVECAMALTKIKQLESLAMRLNVGLARVCVVGLRVIPKRRPCTAAWKFLSDTASGLRNQKILGLEV